MSAQVQSNVGKVIARLERVESRVPPAIDKSILHPTWRETALRVAENTLRTFATEDEQETVGHMLEEFKHEIQQTSDFVQFMLSISAPTIKLYAVTGDDDSFEPLSDEDLRDAIQEWVEKYKDKDKKDRYASGELKSDTEIANNIFYILRPTYPTELTKSAAESLLGSQRETGLGKFLLRNFPSESQEPKTKEEMILFLGDDRVRFLLAAVRAAWLRLLKDSVWRFVRQNIRHEIFKIYNTKKLSTG